MDALVVASFRLGHEGLRARGTVRCRVADHRAAIASLARTPSQLHWTMVLVSPTARFISETTAATRATFRPHRSIMDTIVQ